MQDQCTGHDLISKGPRNVSLTTRKRFPGSKERNGGIMIEGHCTTLFLVTSKREAGFRQYPPPGTRRVSGRRFRLQDKGVDIAGKNERLKRGAISQYHEILCCSRESRTGVGGSETGERGKGVTGDGARSVGMWDSRTHEPLLGDDELVEKGGGEEKRRDAINEMKREE